MENICANAKIFVDAALCVALFSLLQRGFAKKPVQPLHELPKISLGQSRAGFCRFWFCAFAQAGNYILH